MEAKKTKLAKVVIIIIEYFLINLDISIKFLLFL